MATDPLRRDHDQPGSATAAATATGPRPALDATRGDGSHGDSAISIVADLLRQIPELLRKETRLLRTELNEKASQALTAVGLIVGGLTLALTGLIVLAFALVAAIENAGLAPGWAALIVGGGLAVIALALVSKGSSDLKASSLAPERSAHSVQKDANLARGRA